MENIDKDPGDQKSEATKIIEQENSSSNVENENGKIHSENNVNKKASDNSDKINSVNTKGNNETIGIP